ncbi:MAG: hypothetical protein PHW46_05215 [Candidatus Omnitrophica bacterium]|nr:hypothetical protein [Candidatus Omnitrophota bacterium]
MNMCELCKCVPGQVCPFCKILIVAGIAVLSGFLGFLIGKRKK